MIIRLTLIALLASAGTALARDDDPADPFSDWKGENERGVFDYDDSQDKPWQESSAELPALPKDAELLPVMLDSLPANLQASLGSTSLSQDETDRVIRYWIVVRSPSGAYNASFEGMRCETGEYKIYAYGNPKRQPPVQLAPQPAWKSLSPNWRKDYRAEMMRTLLCTEATRARKVSDILATLRGQSPYRDPAADNIDF